MEIPKSSAEYYEIIRPVVKNYQEIERNFGNIPKSTKVVDSNLAIWAVVDGVLLVFILCGNILTILAVRFSRRLRSVISNMFVLSLAISDILVGFTLPYHLSFYMGSGLGKSKELCLMRFFLIILACCNSIWNLIAIAVDRYIAIFFPLHYNRYMTKKVALILLGFGWVAGTLFAMIPLVWNNWETATQCEFDEILKPWYIGGVMTPGFSMVWLCMLIVYWRIWREATKHAKQLRSSFTGLHETHSDSKSVQVVLFILGCFSICWFPYFIIACIQVFKLCNISTPMLYKAVFSLAMANSGMNPIIYAWKNTGFRRAFARLLRCQSPDYCDTSQHSNRSNIQHRKSISIQNHDLINGAGSSVLSTPPPYFLNNIESIPENEITSTTTSTYRDKKIIQHKNTSFSFDIPSSEDEFNNTTTTTTTDTITTTDTTKKLVTAIDQTNKYNKISTIIMEQHQPKHIPSVPDILSSQSNPELQIADIQMENYDDKLNNCTNYKKLIIDKIEYDDNGNTQIHIFSPKTLKQSIDDSFELTLNCKNFKTISKLNNHHNNHHVQFAQLYNGKHIISSNDKIQSEII